MPLTSQDSGPQPNPTHARTHARPQGRPRGKQRGPRQAVGPTRRLRRLVAVPTNLPDQRRPPSGPHWWFPVRLPGLPENFSTKAHDDDDNDELAQIREGVNDFKVPRYRGSNPPVGDHNYEFPLYARDAFPKVPKKPGRDRLVEAMEGHILAEAVLVGHYNKDHYGTENVKGYHPTGVPQHSGPGRAQLKSQHNNTRVTTVAHQ